MPPKGLCDAHPGLVSDIEEIKRDIRDIKTDNRDLRDYVIAKKAINGEQIVVMQKRDKNEEKKVKRNYQFITWGFAGLAITISILTIILR